MCDVFVTLLTVFVTHNCDLQNVLKLYMDYDMALYDQCAKEYSLKEQAQSEKRETEESKWRKIEMLAAANAAASPSS